jgi:hypothetical protein
VPNVQHPYRQRVRSWAAARALGRLVNVEGSFRKGPDLTAYTLSEVERTGGRPSQSFSSLVTALRNGKTEVRLVHEIPRR